MNESRKTNKLHAFIDRVEKKFASMNKGSKMLVKIAFYILSAFMMIALFLVLSNMTGMVHFNNQTEIIKWVILYSFRTWALLFCGALILDYLIGGQQNK